MQVKAWYYDGRQAKRHEVSLSLEDDVLHILGPEIQRQAALSAVKIQAPLGNTPRLILFSDGARCEVADHQAFAALLPDAGSSLLADLESHWPFVWLALLLTIGVAMAGYVWGLPYAARQVAARLPDSVLQPMDSQILDTLDKSMLTVTELPPERQQQLREELKQLVLPPGATAPKQLLFRASPKLGANAFALPGGSIVVLDKLVALAANDEEILAVLAHEMGHVSHRDALRQMLQASAVSMFMTWYIGDVRGLLASAPALLLQTNYSRDLEQHADLFAAQLLRLNAIPANRLADMLEKLAAAHQEQPIPADDTSKSLFDYISTHPNTGERIKTLRQM
jgi:Zn-dependent protease with chaperone function